MKKQKGFTLIELLVVISIIALLLAILMPALGKVKEKAKLVVCSSNQHQLIIGVNIYAADYSNTLPPNSTKQARANLLSRRNDTGDTYQYKYLGGYLPDVDVFNCPSSKFDKNLSLD
ncbi:MAG: type II secretion system protein, partial [Anaerohalosphaera sp.]|nr:type II secretion system protein [Anaerohalosphaera sp.]